MAEESGDPNHRLPRSSQVWVEKTGGCRWDEAGHPCTPLQSPLPTLTPSTHPAASTLHIHTPAQRPPNLTLPTHPGCVYAAATSTQLDVVCTLWPRAHSPKVWRIVTPCSAGVDEPRGEPRLTALRPPGSRAAELEPRAGGRGGRTWAGRAPPSLPRT